MGQVVDGAREDLARERQALCEALLRVSRGDTAALKEVYDRTSAKLFGVCLRILGEASESEDVLQEVYLTVWRSAGSFDAGRASPITWLAAIARNRAIDRIRSRHPDRYAPLRHGLDVADASPSALTNLEDDEERQRLASCLGGLEEPQRSAIRRAFFDGVTYEALASQAGVPIGTMKSWIRRALLKLRGCLDQ